MAVNFKINGKPYKVLLQNFPPDITLNTFIRQHANLSGTKFMCLEGGCGVCICVVKGKHPNTKKMNTWATNSCLTLLNICDGWEVITVEGIGNRKDGYHPIQTRLAQLNGTQCGYCSPAMVMNMYGLLESKEGKLGMEEVENSFGGNICRCTGYRPILDAMKSFAINSEFEFIEPCKDIEDLDKTCPKTGSKCGGSCTQKKLHVVFDDDKEWIQALSLEDILQAFVKIGSKTYMLVAGNTAHGVYRRPKDIQIFIDVNKVPELHSYSITENELQLGGNLNLTEAMEILRKASTTPGFEYCKNIVSHIDLIANVPVRNMGTLAGNLSIKNQHKEFPSDLYIMLESLSAKIVLIGTDAKPTHVLLLSFLDTDMSKKVISHIILDPKPSSDYFFNSYKVMPRAQNAHAYINSGFLLRVSNDVVREARLCFGGISPDFTHALQTEKFLIGKQLFSNETIKGAMASLNKELMPDWNLPDASPEYRRNLACGLFYKFILNIAPEQAVKQEFKSGKDILHRPLSSGTQTYDTRKDMYPITKPIPKIEALAQCSGEAFYMNDLPPIPGELWAAFVHATKINSKIAQIDPSPALDIPGVVAFFSAKDIPGKNSFVQNFLFGYDEDELIFCEDFVKYHSQPLGVIVAETSELAKIASEKVKVLYENPESRPMPTLEDVFKYKAFDRIHSVLSNNQIESVHNKDTLVESSIHIQGNLDIGSQYHFTMEPQTCVCIPTEDGMDIYSASQWMDLAQTVIANCLNVKKSKLFLQVRRLGGGYGGKISRSVQIACACALASWLLNKPIRFVQSLESMMSSLGKRFGCHSDYLVDVNEKGNVLKLQNTFYEDSGSSLNESPTMLAILAAVNCYHSDANWKIDGKNVRTDAPSHTFCRAPGTLEGIAMIENIMDHIACMTDQDPANVRLRNLKPGHKMEDLLPNFLSSVSYEARRPDINDFNKTNRWRKKGLGLAIMEFPAHYFSSITAAVTIYQGDGSVSVSHGGIEMGQGLNTKVTQVAAHVLDIPMDMIRIHPSDSFNGANSTVTGGGIGSETVCFATKKACEDLLYRMKPIREALKNPSWLDVVTGCFRANISLTAHHSHKQGDLQPYVIHGLCLSEVEVDILTGNILVNRVDILEDTGESLSPLIDIGQIEGAFIMGIGYWLTEKLIYNRQTGELLTNRTWTYKPPGAKDIPVDFRITLLQKNPNPAGFLRSKATGEPPACLAVSTIFAIRHALNSSRADAGVTEKWFHLGAPTTPEDILLNSGTSIDMFTLS